MLEQFGKLLLKDVSISAIFPAEISGKYLAPYVVSNRTTNQLFVTLSGKREYYTLQGEHFILTARPGDVLLMPIGASYTTIPITNSCKGIAFLFNLQDEETSEEIVLNDQVCLVTRDADGSYTKIFYQILEENQRGGIALLKSKSLVYEVLYNLAYDNLMLQTGSQQKSIQPAINYMLKHLQSTISIQELADMCFMSKSTFHRRFLKEVGLPPNTYHLNMRIEKSRKLLKSGLYTVEEVAELMGFCDTGYFSRVFFKRTGQHAGNFRNHIGRT